MPLEDSAAAVPDTSLRPAKGGLSARHDEAPGAVKRGMPAGCKDGSEPLRLGGEAKTT